MKKFLRLSFTTCILFLVSYSSISQAKSWSISPDEIINWKLINDGDVICLTGTRFDSLVVRKNVTIDGACESEESASIVGAFRPQWIKQGSRWRTVKPFPLDYGRYAGWVIKDGRIQLLDDAGIVREGDYFISSILPVDISIPKYYAAIRAFHTTNLVIKNVVIKNFIVHGIVVSTSENTVIDNVHVSFVGGGVNPKGHKRAGAGITFDGNTYNALVKDSVVSQCFDTGISIQLFKKFSESAKKIRFLNNAVNRCGAGVSIAVHKPYGSRIEDVEIVGKFTNLGYGWSGIHNNNVHGRGVMIKQFKNSTVANVRLHDSLIDTYAWVGVLQYSGELDSWNNIIKNGTGEYTMSKNLRPSAFTASGGDYSVGPSDAEAIGSFVNNRIVDINGYAIQVVHNTPKKSTRQLTVKENHASGYKEYLRFYHSSGLLQ